LLCIDGVSRAITFTVAVIENRLAVATLDGSMQGKEKVFLDVSESIDAFKVKKGLWMHRMKSGKLAAFPALNLFVEKKVSICTVFVPSFLNTSIHVFLSWIGIFLLTITAKYLTEFEVLFRCQR